MKIKILSFSLTSFLILFCLSAIGNASAQKAPSDIRVPILLYHRFGPKIADSMTVTTNAFAAEMKYIKDNGYTVIPLRQLVDYYRKLGPPPPPKSVVLVADDGHKSVYSDMLPIIRKYRFPVTLFIYPSVISNASYAMTWQQLRELKKTGLFDMQAHTYWHPNFKKEKKRLGAAEYDKLVEMQLRKPKEKLDKELGARVELLAWPFGIYDDELTRKARENGYVAAFSIERRQASIRDNIMAIPRFLMTATDKEKGFEALLDK